MRFTTLAFIGAAAAAPVASPQDLSALLGSLGGSSNGPDLGALLGGLTGGAPGGAPPIDFGALLGSLGGGGAAGGGLDIGALLGGLGGAGGAGGAGGFDIGGLLAGFSGSGGEAKTIIDSYGGVKEKVDALDAFVTGFNVSVPADVIAKLEKSTMDQVAALNAGTEKINKMAGQIGIMDALSLQEPGGSLTAATLTSIENLKKAKGAISKVAGAREAEIKNLNSLLDATKAFNEAVNKKLPSLAVTIAQGEAQKSVDALTDAIAEYNKA